MSNFWLLLLHSQLTKVAQNPYNSLYFPNSPFNLFVSDVPSTSGVNTFDTVTYCFTVTNTSVPFKVTLVWTDYPGDMNSIIALVNDLDLAVGVGNTVYYGNAIKSGLHYEHDFLNNVEQVIVNNITNGTNVTVTIRGSNVPKGPQDFAIAVTGAFTVINQDCKTLIPCQNNCTDRGNCSAGFCICNSSYTGADCSVESTPLVTGTQVTGQLTQYLWAYYHYDIPEGFNGNLKVDFSSVNGQGDPDLYITYNGYPSLMNYNFSNTDCDSCGIKPSGHTLIPANKVFGGQRLRIGIYGYCCDISAYKLTINSVSSGLSIQTIMFIVVGVLAGIISIVSIVIYYRHRIQNRKYNELAQADFNEDDADLIPLTTNPDTPNDTDE